MLVAPIPTPPTTSPTDAPWTRVRANEWERANCAVLYAPSVDTRPKLIRRFMLTHGKEVRRVSFYPTALEALSGKALRRNAEVSFWLVFGNFLTFIDVKYSIYKFL